MAFLAWAWAWDNPAHGAEQPTVAEKCAAILQLRDAWPDCAKDPRLCPTEDARIVRAKVLKWYRIHRCRVKAEVIEP
jgi:hypothetical protein